MRRRAAGRRAPRRVVLGLTEISGYWTRLHRGLLDLGVDATLVLLDDHPYGYPTATSRMPVVRLIRRLRRGRRHLPSRAAEAAARVVLLLWALLRFDTFVFGYRTSFLNTRDLWLLRALGRTVVMVFHGSDERPPYMDGYLELTDEQLGPVTRRQRRLVRRCDRWADVVVSNPNSGQFHCRPCLTYHVLGNPVASDVAPTPARTGTVASRPVRVLHAPSNPVAKGSDVVRAACRDLAERGVAIELDEVQGVDNTELHRRILAADIVVDQAYGDCTWAMFAAEAGLLGRPVIVGGHGHDHLRRFLPPDLVPPGVYCAPDGLADALLSLASDEARRLELGRASREFALEHWTPERVAARLVRVLRGDAPPDWFFDPHEIRYCWGGGPSIPQTRHRVRALVSRAGVAGLGLDDKPELRDLLLAEIG